MCNRALSIANGASISASTLSTGKGGVANVTATTLLLDNSGNSPNPTGIFAESIIPKTGGVANPGAAGTVHVQATSLAVQTGTFISAATSGAAAAGGVTVDADSIVMSGGGIIASDADGTGAAGSVSVHSRTLQIFSNAQITSDAFSTGAGGNVNVTVNEGLLIDSQNVTGAGVTGITANTNSTGAGGNAGTVSVQAGSIILRNKGHISSDSQGGGSAAKVSVNADSINILTSWHH